MRQPYRNTGIVNRRKRRMVERQRIEKATKIYVAAVESPDADLAAAFEEFRPTFKPIRGRRIYQPKVFF